MMTLLQKFEEIFGRIPETQGLNQLETIVEKFSAIPYENLTKIIQAHDVSDPEARLRQPLEVLAGFQHWGSGGTCFSLTHCLREILNSCGYVSYFHLADLSGGRNNHCALTVAFPACRYLIDPGYLITKPLPLPEAGSVIHLTRLYPVRLEASIHRDYYFLSTMEPGGEKFRYQLQMKECSESEFRSYWIDSFHWSMMHSILISRVMPEGRFYLHDRHVRWIHRELKRTEKIKEHYDSIIAAQTGIDERLVRRARLLLAQDKPAMAEKT